MGAMGFMAQPYGRVDPVTNEWIKPEMSGLDDDAMQRSIAKSLWKEWANRDFKWFDA